MTDITYKLPRQILYTHQAELDAIDWSSKQQHAVRLGDQGFLLEVIQRDYQTIVRPATARHAIALRNYAMSLGPEYRPSDDETAAVLASRNPAEEDEQA